MVRRTILSYVSCAERRRNKTIDSHNLLAYHSQNFISECVFHVDKMRNGINFIALSVRRRPSHEVERKRETIICDDKRTVFIAKFAVALFYVLVCHFRCLSKVWLLVEVIRFICQLFYHPQKTIRRKIRIVSDKLI